MNREVDKEGGSSGSSAFDIQERNEMRNAMNALAVAAVLCSAGVVQVPHTEILLLSAAPVSTDLR